MPTKKPNIRAYSLAFVLPLVLALLALTTWAQAPDPNSGDSEMVGGGTNLPPRLEARRFRITFQDEFNGPQPGMSPAKLACFDWAQTPAQCAQENWPTGNCDAAYAANLADLDKCTWLVHDRYNWWSYHEANENGVNRLHPSMVSVHDGKLWLNAGLDPDADLDQPCDFEHPENCPIRSGGVESGLGCVSEGSCQLYGRFEIRARIPMQPGSFPAHWILPFQGDHAEDGEIDIMEATHDTILPHSSVHMDPERTPGVDYGMHSKHYHMVEHGLRYRDEFHTFAAEWSPTEVVFFIDELEIGRMRVGEPLKTYDHNQEVGKPLAWVEDHYAYTFAKSFYFILNTSVLGQSLGERLENFAPMTHEIDWVRIYEACPATSTDPQCRVIGSGSAEITNDPWMNVEKWQADLRRTVVADFDGNGADDLILQQNTEPGHATYQLLADGQGRFGPEKTITEDAAMSEWGWASMNREALAGDFDGDGDDDLLLRPTGPDLDAYLLDSIGNGLFAPRQTVTEDYWMINSKWSTQYRSGHVVDWNGDGRMDLVLVGKEGNHHTYWLRGKASGGFEPEITLSNLYGTTPAHWRQDWREALFGDFNGDDAADVLLRGRTTTQSSYLILSDGNGGHGPLLNVTNAFVMNSIKWADTYRQAVVGDFSGDGRDDVLLRSRGTGHSTYLLVADSGGGAFRNEVTVDNQFWMLPVLWGANLRDAHVGDFNGDGADDLVLVPKQEGAVASFHAAYLLPGGKNQVFGNARNITEAETLSQKEWATSRHRFVVGDWDGDGADDILLQGRQGQIVDSPLLNPQEMVRLTDLGSDQTYVIYLPSSWFQ